MLTPSTTRAIGELRDELLAAHAERFGVGR